LKIGDGSPAASVRDRYRPLLRHALMTPVAEAIKKSLFAKRPRIILPKKIADDIEIFPNFIKVLKNLSNLVAVGIDPIASS